MTNILNLPQVPAQAFVLSTDGDWLDSFFFPRDTSTPPNPLDITGIRFRIDWRRNTDGQIIIPLDTNGSNFINYGASGYLGINLLVATRPPLFPAVCTGDLIATADGYSLNLSEAFGPMTVTIRSDTL